MLAYHSRHNLSIRVKRCCQGRHECCTYSRRHTDKNREAKKYLVREVKLAGALVEYLHYHQCLVEESANLKWRARICNVIGRMKPVTPYDIHTLGEEMVEPEG